MTVRLLQHLYSSLDSLPYYYSSLINWAVLLLSPPICPMYLLLFLTAQTLRWLLFCIANMVVIPNFLKLSTMGFIFSFVDLILGICCLSQNRIDRFCWTSFTLIFWLATLCQKASLFVIWHIWWPNILLSYKQAMSCCAIY